MRYRNGDTHSLCLSTPTEQRPKSQVESRPEGIFRKSVYREMLCFPNNNQSILTYDLCLEPIKGLNVGKTCNNYHHPKWCPDHASGQTQAGSTTKGRFFSSSFSYSVGFIVYNKMDYAANIQNFFNTGRKKAAPAKEKLLRSQVPVAHRPDTCQIRPFSYSSYILLIYFLYHLYKKYMRSI